MHPILKDGTSLGRYQEGEDTFYFAGNAEGDEFVISPRLYNALKTADGTHPLELPDRGRQLLPRLKEAGLVQTSRFVRSNGLINRFILFPISRQSRGSPVCGCINALLPPLAVLVFFAGRLADAGQPGIHRISVQHAAVLLPDRLFRLLP